MLWRCGSLAGWENEAGEECSINAMAPLFEVYREAERADIKKEKKTKVYRPNENRASSMDMQEEIYYLLVAGAWLIHAALRRCYIWGRTRR